ncbi:hypothetical protein RCJ22_25815 [Vibrio sp. FNV 38]|nr:hypothetical protein [Vibrio sp. FNV 38]
MNKVIAIVGLATVLFGCEDAANTVEQAKESATEMVGDMQEKIESVDLESLNLEQFDGAKEQIQQLTMSAQEVLSTDFTNAEAVTEAKGKVANAYRCLVDASSSMSAEQVINKIKSAMTNEEAVEVIEQGIEEGEETECMM